MTIKDLVDWVKVNRYGKAFEKFNDREIAHTLAVADKTQSLALVHIDNELVGLCTWEPCHESKTMRVTHLLCTYPYVIDKLLNVYRQRFSGYRIVARRHGRDRTYNMERFLKKLAKL
jgi:hypothetical protein